MKPCKCCNGEGIILKLRKKESDKYGTSARNDNRKERLKVCPVCKGKGYED